jgi:hypothetical protein
LLFNYRSKYTSSFLVPAIYSYKESVAMDIFPDKDLAQYNERVRKRAIEELELTQQFHEAMDEQAKLIKKIEKAQQDIAAAGMDATDEMYANLAKHQKQLAKEEQSAKEAIEKLDDTNYALSLFGITAENATQKLKDFANSIQKFFAGKTLGEAAKELFTNTYSTMNKIIGEGYSTSAAGDLSGKYMSEFTSGAAIVGHEKFGESVSELAKLYRSYDDPLNMKGLTSAVAHTAKMFSMTSADAAAFMSNLNRFGGMSAEDAEGFANRLLNSGQVTSLMGEQMSSIKDDMHKFNLGADGANDAFVSMLTTSSKLGVNIGNIVKSLDKFTDFKEAMTEAVDLSRIGSTVSPLQLMAAGMGSAQATESLMTSAMSDIGSMMSATGNISQEGRFKAQRWGQTLGMSETELIRAAQLSKASGGKSSAVEELKNIREQNLRAATLREQTNELLVSILSNLEPVIKTLTSFLKKNEPWLKHVLVLLTAGFAGVVAGLNVLAGILTYKTLTGGGGVMNVGRGFLSKFGLGAAAASPAGGGLPAGGGGGAGRFGSFFGKMPSASSMLQTAAAAVVFAGAIWVLAKALQQFNSVEWKSLGKAALALVGLMGVMFMMGVFVSAFGWLLLGGAAAIAAFGFALMPLAWALQMFGSVSGSAIKELAEALPALAWGIGLLAGAGALFALGGPLAAIGLFMALGTVVALGAIASKYSGPIVTLAEGINLLADAMGRLNSISISDAKFDKIEGQLNRLSKIKIEGAASAEADLGQPLLISQTINMDARKVGEAMYEYNIKRS